MQGVCSKKPGCCKSCAVAKNQSGKDTPIPAHRRRLCWTFLPPCLNNGFRNGKDIGQVFYCSRHIEDNPSSKNPTFHIVSGLDKQKVSLTLLTAHHTSKKNREFVHVNNT
eukprot:gene1885-2137_t